MTRAKVSPLAAIVAIIIVGAVGAVGIAMANDDSSSTVACASGQWTRATVTKANGEKLTAENRRQLPKGYSATTSSGDQALTINSDGSVEAKGGAVTVECIAPTK